MNPNKISAKPKREPIDGKDQNVGHAFPFEIAILADIAYMFIIYFGLLEIIFAVNFIATTGVVIPNGIPMHHRSRRFRRCLKYFFFLFFSFFFPCIA